MYGAVGQERIYHLWDELQAVPAADADQALAHLMGTVSGWIGADKAHWTAAACFPETTSEPDGLGGWRICAYQSLYPYTNAELGLIQNIRRQRAAGKVDAGATTHALVAGAGTYRTRRLHDGFISISDFQQTPHYQLHYGSFGIVDRLWSIAPVSENAEAYFFFDLLNTEQRFTAEDAALVATTLRGLRWLHLRLFLGRGILIAQKPLTKRQRQIIHALLGGKSEREIAQEFDQSPATTHKHIETIYRAFGVNSRAALMALWLAGG